MEDAAENSQVQEPSRLATGFGEGQVGSAGKAKPESPRASALPVRLQAAATERRAALRLREALERHSMLRGLLLLALLVLGFSLLHAGMDRAFPAGWWRRW